MTKILLIGSHLGSNLEGMLYNAFQDLQCDIEFFSLAKGVEMPSLTRYCVSRSKALKYLFQSTLLSSINHDLLEVVIRSSPDILLIIKGEYINPSTLKKIKEKINVKLVLWYPDDPRYFKELVEEFAYIYDAVFTSSYGSIKRYYDAGFKNVTFLPFACSPALHKKLALQKNVDISFIGSWYKRRGKLIRELERANLGNIEYYGPFWNIVSFSKKHSPIWGAAVTEKINSSRIALNIHEASDLNYKPNMRTFEIPACGTLMVTDRPHMIENFFLPGKEVIIFDSVKELIELVKYYLDSETEREEIANMGYIRAHRDHTYKHRAQIILKHLKIET